MAKKIIALLLMCCMLFSLAGCGEVKKEETTVKNTFTALKSLDFPRKKQIRKWKK